MAQLVPLIKSISFIPRVRRSSFHVVGYNYVVFRSNLLMNLLWIGFEPLVYLYALGYGVGRLIPDIHGVTYFNFFYPGLIAVTAMIVPSYETTHGTYSRAHYEKSFTSLFFTPITKTDLFLGEILWGALKGVIAVFILITAVVLLEKLSPLRGLAMLSVAFFISWFFAALGLLANSCVRRSENFIYYQVGFLIPMAMLSGAYFPVEYLPEILQVIIKLLPMTYAVAVFRELSSGVYSSNLIFSAAYFLFFGLIFTNLALIRQNEKLTNLLD